MRLPVINFNFNLEFEFDSDSDLDLDLDSDSYSAVRSVYKNMYLLYACSQFVLPIANRHMFTIGYIFLVRMRMRMQMRMVG